MSRSKRMLKLLQRQVLGTIVCKDVLVVLPIEYFIKGFLLETTIERDMVYLWRVIMPLYCPTIGLNLDYSERIYDRQKVYIDRQDYPGSAERVLRIIGSEHVDYLRSIRTPEDFLRRHAPALGDRPIVPSDISQLRWRDFVHALTHYLVGNVSASLDAIRQMDAEIARNEERWRLYRLMKEPVKRFLHEAEASPSRGRALMDHWVNENIEKFGLQEAMRLSSEMK